MREQLLAKQRLPQRVLAVHVALADGCDVQVALRELGQAEQ